MVHVWALLWPPHAGGGIHVPYIYTQMLTQHGTHTHIYTYTNTPWPPQAPGMSVMYIQAKHSCTYNKISKSKKLKQIQLGHLTPLPLMGRSEALFSLPCSQDSPTTEGVTKVTFPDPCLTTSMQVNSTLQISFICKHLLGREFGLVMRSLWPRLCVLCQTCSYVNVSTIFKGDSVPCHPSLAASSLWGKPRLSHARQSVAVLASHSPAPLEPLLLIPYLQNISKLRSFSHRVILSFQFPLAWLGGYGWGSLSQQVQLADGQGCCHRETRIGCMPVMAPPQDQTLRIRDWETWHQPTKDF